MPRRADYRSNLLAHVPEDIAAAVLKAEITCTAIDVERSIAALSPEKPVGAELAATNLVGAKQ